MTTSTHICHAEDVFSRDELGAIIDAIDHVRFDHPTESPIESAALIIQEAMFRLQDKDGSGHE